MEADAVAIAEDVLEEAVAGWGGDDDGLLCDEGVDVGEALFDVDEFLFRGRAGRGGVEERSLTLELSAACSVRRAAFCVFAEKCFLESTAMAARPVVALMPSKPRTEPMGMWICRVLTQM